VKNEALIFLWSLCLQEDFVEKKTVADGKYLCVKESSDTLSRVSRMRHADSTRCIRIFFSSI